MQESEGYHYRYEFPKDSILYTHYRPQDQESLKEILHDSSNGGIDVKPYIQRIAFNMSHSTNFGYRIGGTVGDDLLKEIATVEVTMAFYRSTSSIWQDYVPLPRLFSKRTSGVNSWKVRRQKYMSDLRNLLEQKIVEGTDKPCISGSILKDPESKGLNKSKLLPHWVVHSRVYLGFGGSSDIKILTTS